MCPNNHQYTSAQHTDLYTAYFFPNDPSERDRLDFQYEILKYAFSDKNYFAPLKDPRTILDIGTGTGQWAIEMGDEFPNAEVQGTDLSPIQPSSVPQNVHFFVDDASEPDWVLPPDYFDYIHTRVLLGCFTDFKAIINRSFHYLKPGGFMESQEIMSTPYCDDGTMPDNWPFKEWMATLDEAAMQADRPLRIASRLKRWYQEAGFVDVQEKVFKMPINPWPRDRHLKFLGRMSEDNWLSGLQALSLAPFSRTLSWSKDEIEVCLPFSPAQNTPEDPRLNQTIQVYLVDVRKAISDRNIHAYHKIYVVWGRKPEEGETSDFSRAASIAAP